MALSLLQPSSRLPNTRLISVLYFTVHGIILSLVMLEENLQKALEKRASENSLRKLKISEGMVDFCSNDYLGFARKEWSVEGARGAVGSGGSRLISGTHKVHEEFESWLAEFHEVESALLFNSGYDANLGLFATVPKKGDTVIYDKLCHASIRDGLRLSAARSFSFKHNDVEDLRGRLANASGEVFVVVESVYSMDGDMAELAAVGRLCEEHGANLIVDEAHATGVFGERGEGLCQKLGVECFARIHTFGKAVGCHGAVVVGSNVLKEYLVNFCRSFIYTTALPPHSVRLAWAAYEANVGNVERGKLRANIELFKAGFNGNGLIESESPIQCVVIGGNDRCKGVAVELQKFGLDVRPILHPTVEEGKERIRICLHSYNSREEIAQLCERLNEVI